MDEIKLTLDNESNFSSEETREEKSIESFDDSKKEIELSSEEEKQIKEFSEKIDINNPNLVLQYGSASQNKIAEFSQKTLEKVKSSNLDEIGDLLSGIVTELKNFEIDEEEKGISRFFKKSANKINSTINKFNSVEANVNKVKGALEKHQVQLLKDIAVLEEMYELNKNYYKELTMYIMAGKEKLKKAKEEELPKLLEKAQRSNLPIDAQNVSDYRDMIDRFEKKLHDLELTRMVALQSAPQIRMVQSSNNIMVEKIQSTIVNTIPLWKSQMVIALSANHSLEAAKAQKEVSDFTNDLLRKNADKLKMATVETAKESQRSIVDIETIKHTNEKLIEALIEVRDIQKEGSEKRELASSELLKIEEHLKNSLIDINSER